MVNNPEMGIFRNEEKKMAQILFNPVVASTIILVVIELCLEGKEYERRQIIFNFGIVFLSLICLISAPEDLIPFKTLFIVKIVSVSLCIFATAADLFHLPKGGHAVAYNIGELCLQTLALGLLFA